MTRRQCVILGLGALAAGMRSRAWASPKLGYVQYTHVHPLSPKIVSGDTVVFLGDSITREGWDRPDGYVHRVVSGLAAAGVAITPIPAGRGGQRAPELAARVRDLLAKEPTWLLVQCGLNDALLKVRTPLAMFGMAVSIVAMQARAARVRVMLLTTTVVGQAYRSEENQRLGRYNDVLRAKALEHGCLLADVNAAFAEAIARHPRHALTVDDRVHLSPRGNCVMAQAILRTFGVSRGNAKEEKGSDSRTTNP